MPWNITMSAFKIISLVSIWLLIILPIGYVESKNDLELQFDNFSCTSDDVNGNFLQRYSCGLSKNVKRRTMSMQFVLTQPLYKHQFHIMIKMPRRTIDFVLLNRTIDGCSFLANKKQVKLMKISRSILKRYSNFPNQCPFEQEKTYYIRGFRLDLNLIPAMSLETPVYMNFTYKIGQLSLLKGYMTALVVLKGNKKQGKAQVN